MLSLALNSRELGSKRMTAPSRKKLILASGSASRRQMLRAAGLTFDVIPSRVDEPALRRSLEAASTGPPSPDALAAALAAAKARDVAAAHPQALVIGADQVLALGRCLYEKPRDRAEARAHLGDFRDSTHVLHSAVALATADTVLWEHISHARMTMRRFSDAFLDAYLASAGDAILSSVGAYQLEGLGIQLFERIEGDYFTILGMPLLPLLAELRNRKALVE
jgi:septum formation protein